MVRSSAISVELPPVTREVLDRLAARVRMDPADLIADAVRCSPLIRAELARSFPAALVRISK